MARDYFREKDLKKIKYEQTGINYQKIIPIRRPDSCKSNLGLERKFRDKF
jgi:hypothetical protein